MTAARTRTRRYRPEPSRWWICHVPAPWPGAGGLWTHLADRTLGAAKVGDLPEVDSAALSDLVYLPPVAEENRPASDALAQRLLSAQVPVLRQCQPGQTLEPGTEKLWVLDLLAALLEDGIASLDRLETPCSFAVWPLIPGLTASPEVWQPGLDRLAASGLQGVVPQTLDLGPGERRRLSGLAGETGYQALFHGKRPDERAFCRAAAERGLATTPERPRHEVTPRLDFCRRVATELVLVGDLWLRLDRPEAAGQNLLRAARWAEEFEHDLRAVAREGNLAVLPWLDGNAIRVVTELAADQPSSLRRELELEYAGGA